ncbi:hypothetical protein GP2_027_00010 [Gordonia paraffinivorans NBRC 108238]|uniref:DUF3558 domain-containing protein n=2 Tax=Gordonia paraffinivorans TaxID=175628 RepID=A0ABQ0IMS2_9ACTN|nr:hypothetical protein GP2_027_00010 [Gordonia paraffinivorans NBRC 108238]
MALTLVALLLTSCSHADSGTDRSEPEMATTSSSNPENHHAPWPLDQVAEIMPAGLDGLTANACADDAIDPDTLICVVLRDAGGARVGWIRATRQGAPAALDEFENDEEIYRGPMFEVTRVAENTRHEFGEYAYVMRQLDLPEVWTLRADRATIQAGFPRGAVRADDLLAMARQVLHRL